MTRSLHKPGYEVYVKVKQGRTQQLQVTLSRFVWDLG